MFSRRSIPAAGVESPANGARAGTTSTPHTPSIIKGVVGLGSSGIPQLRKPPRAGGGVRSCCRRGDRGAGQPAGRGQPGAGRAAWTQGPHSHTAPAPALGGRGRGTGPNCDRTRTAARRARPERRRRQLACPRGARLACQPSEQSPEQDSPSHLVAPHPNPTTERLQKNPAGERGFSQCAREDSNLHGPSVHKALNLARLPIPPQALGTASIARQNGSVLGQRYLTEHMFA